MKRKVDGDVLDDCEIKNSKKKKATDPECGTLVFCGTTDFANVLKPTKLAEQSFLSKLNVHEPVLLAALQGVRIRHVGSGPEAGHLFVVDDAGQVWSWGNNDAGQLGLGDMKSRRVPSRIPIGENGEASSIVMISCGKKHTLLLTSQGEVLAAGDNSDGQCGKGEMKVVKAKNGVEVEICSVPMLTKFEEIDYKGPPVVKVSAGANFSMLLDIEGHVWTFGNQEFGQLGNGTNGSYNAAEARVDLHFAGIPQAKRLMQCFRRDSKTKKVKEIEMLKARDISAGSHHAAMVDELDRVFTWGQGRYGATGHGETVDIHVPTWVAALDHPRGKVKAVACGHTVTVMHGKLFGHRYLAGVLDPRSQEVNMTPKQYFGMGHSGVRDIAFWKRGFVAVNEDGKVTVSNRGPCFGELGLGKHIATSGPPKPMKQLEFSHVLMVGTGVNMCIYVLRDTEEEDKEELEEGYDLLDQTD